MVMVVIEIMIGLARVMDLMNLMRRRQAPECPGMVVIGVLCLIGTHQDED